MNLSTLIKNYIDIGYGINEANAKVCQDIILIKLSKSPFYKNVTIKGGVVMHSISNDIRRATKDLDIDFIKYSLSDSSIGEFISKLNSLDDGVNISIIKNIIELKQQDYHGKRVYVRLKDNFNNELTTKLDIGVHNNFDIKQEEYCFNLNAIKESATLLINSKEQIFAEKLKSLLRLGGVSTRYKDILDFYYLISTGKINKIRLLKYIEAIIFNDDSLDENNISDVYETLKLIFKRKRFLNNFNTVKNNWLELPVIDVTDTILKFILELEPITV